MTLRTLFLASAFGLAAAPAIRAGDTVTDNLPGGATQAPGAGAMASQLNAAPPGLSQPMIAPNGQQPPTASGGDPAPAPGVGPPPASYAMRSTSGRSFSTASPFIGRVLNFYAPP